uniref:Integrase zinc-binding domain-containing protein n=1 Tax=Ananas comosus var. bracteatus TaxID=296719 RepID=A0A6V7P947_ANACO|nr:unnamed protein product [Ananas comosus var. bracteatus]
MALVVQPTLLERIKEKQVHDVELQKIRANCDGYTSDFHMDDRGLLRLRDRICVLAESGIKKEILLEAHQAPYTLHPRGTKMYKDLKLLYWWPGMKKVLASL